MTREVICYVTNNTPEGYYVQSINNDHGEPTTNPQTITSYASNEQAFYYRKTTGSFYGVTGSVTYKLQDGSMLVLVFNNPYTQSGQNGEGGYSGWFYAALNNIPSSGTSYAIECSVSIGGASMNPYNPPNADTITAWVTINLNSSFEKTTK